MPKTFDFSENYFVPIHRFTFDHSISFKKLLKRKGNSITQAKTNVPISQTCSEGLKLIIQTDQMKTKILIMKLGQLEEEITKVSLSINADLSNYFISIILETDQRKNYPS